MLNHRYDVHQPCLTACFIADEFDEANQLISQEGSDENTLLEITGFFLAYHLDGLSIMTKWLPLANGAFVVDRPDAMNESIIKGHFSYGNAFLLRLLGFVASFEADLFIPPFIKS